MRNLYDHQEANQFIKNRNNDIIKVLSEYDIQSIINNNIVYIQLSKLINPNNKFASNITILRKNDKYIYKYTNKTIEPYTRDEVSTRIRRSECYVSYEDLASISRIEEMSMDERTRKIFIDLEPQEPCNSMVKLTKSDGSTIQLMIRKDGYVNATQLCKAGGKLFIDWYRTKEHKRLVEQLSKSMKIFIDLLVDIKLTGPNELRGTFVHPDIAIQIAQWLSPDFAIQVSRWVRELHLTGKVELGKEMNNEQLHAATVAYYEDNIREKDSQITTMELKMKKLEDSNKRFKKKINYHKMEMGNCVYIMQPKLTDIYKYGITQNINERLKHLRREKMRIRYIMYIEKNDAIEQMLKMKYDYKPKEGENVNAPLEEIIDYIRELASIGDGKYTEASPETLEKYNQSAIELEDEDSEEDVPTAAAVVLTIYEQMIERAKQALQKHNYTPCEDREDGWLIKHKTTHDYVVHFKCEHGTVCFGTLGALAKGNKSSRTHCIDCRKHRHTKANSIEDHNANIITKGFHVKCIRKDQTIDPIVMYRCTGPKHDEEPIEYRSCVSFYKTKKDKCIGCNIRYIIQNKDDIPYLRHLEYIDDDKETRLLHLKNSTYKWRCLACDQHFITPSAMPASILVTRPKVCNGRVCYNK